MNFASGIVLFLGLAPVVFGQSTQIGGFGGGGGVVQLFENSAYHAVAGAEACVLCGGRLGLFMEYQHWQKTGQGTDQPVSMDLGAAGIRIQGKNERIRTFFDVGFVGGTEKKDSIYLPFQLARQGVIGGMLGFGAAISVTEHWYVRPLVRLIGITSPEAGGFIGAAVGYRF